MNAWARLASFVLVLSTSAQLAIAEDLDQLRAAIEDSRDRVGIHEAQERRLLEQIEEVDTRLDALRADVASAQADADRSRAEFEARSKQTAQLAASLERTRASLRKRAVALYKQGDIGPVKVLFSSESLPEMVLRWGSLRTLVKTDAELARRYRDQFAAHQEALVHLEEAASRSDAAARELAASSRQLEAQRENKRRLVRQVHEDRVLERTLLVELERAARTLQETIAAFGGEAPLVEGRTFQSDFAKQRGRLPKPVRGVLKSRFGRVVDPEFRTETFRRGAEFAAEPGESVRAVADGVVRFQGWFRGYGKMVVIDHGSDYFSVSGHLQKIYVETGARIEGGDTIGSVGDTGSLSGPGLYFELRRGGEALDPEEWLELPRETARLWKEPAALGPTARLLPSRAFGSRRFKHFAEIAECEKTRPDRGFEGRIPAFEGAQS